MLVFQDPAVSVKNLSKNWGLQAVINNLSFDIPKGKIITILGFSGAGKSTLLRLLLRLLEPTTGRIEILGQDINLMGHHELRDFRRNFGMLFQYAALFDSMTAIDNVLFPMKEFTSMSPEQMKERAVSLLISVGIKESSFSLLPGKLSGGMRKRVGLARALALKPRIMFYDEPTTGLDPITTKRVNDLILKTAQKHQEQQMTSIIISHDVKTSLKISDYIAFLNHGTIVEYLPASEFHASKNELVQRFIHL